MKCNKKGILRCIGADMGGYLEMAMNAKDITKVFEGLENKLQ